MAAAVYDRKGQLFASYQRDPRQPLTLPPHADAGEGQRESIEAGNLLVVLPIIFQGERIGAVAIRADLERRRTRAVRYAGIALLVLLVSLVAASAVVSRMQRHISGPVLHLAATAAVVSREKNYSVRATATSDDELGALIQTFNEMLEQIQQRDTELQVARDELEQRVATRTAELTAANKELEAFSYSVSHDLRAPLRHIDGFCRILVDDFSAAFPPEALGYLHRIGESVRHMGRLLDDLLNLARLGRQEVRRQVTGLGVLVDEVVRELKPDIAGRQVEFRVGDLPYVDCDPVLMKQVFHNLLSNAVKYTRPRQQAVVEVDQFATNGERAIFVRDNGVGFSMKYADKLFGVFQRLHRSEDFEGTGVGLATVQRIVQKHGGRVWAESELDKGATFYLALGSSEATKQPTSVKENADAEKCGNPAG
jgi:signal transduction histidine kinase